MAAERPISAVVVDIVGNVQEIVRSELRLATVELKTRGLQAARSGSLIAAGLVSSLYALGLLLALVVLLLARVMDAWLATLVTLIGIGSIAAALIFLGVRRWNQVHVKPEKTVATVEENVSWMKAQVK